MEEKVNKPCQTQHVEPVKGNFLLSSLKGQDLLYLCNSTN